MNNTQRNNERSTSVFVLKRVKHLIQYCKAYKQKLEAYIVDQNHLASEK